MTTPYKAKLDESSGISVFEVSEHRCPEKEAAIASVAQGSRIIRKVDWHIIPLLNAVYLFCFLDRSNIGNAKLLNVEEDLGLSQAMYSWSLSIFFFGYILFEVPSNLILKAYRPSRWLGIIIVAWGGLCATLAAIHNSAGLLAIRFFLGIAEAGFFPGAIYYLTLWYSPTELCTRMAIFFSASALANAFGGVLAYGIHHMDGAGGLEAWRWLFLLEGIPTILLGVVVYFLLPDSPATVNWLSDAEKEYMVHHLEGDDASVDAAHGWPQVKELARHYRLYIHCLIQIGMAIPNYSIAFLLPTVVKDMGFSTLFSQLLSAPPNVLGMLVCMAVAYHSDRVQERGFHVALPAIAAALGFILIAIVRHQAAQYAMLFIITAGINGCNVVNLSWLANNVPNKTQRAVATATVVAAGNIGGIIAGQMYRHYEAPRYLGSHLANASVLIMSFSFALLLKLLLRRHNRALNAAKGSKDASLSLSPPQYMT
ncbi:hypothetical protein H4R35_000236 [Dimargaris xerosporica]|nr:hypothetical protein H4R35_000236 [Dimargaris xerosporica]